MRLRAIALAASLGMTLAAWPQQPRVQDQRDFVFTDVEGHLVLRFAGSATGELTADQLEEIVNVQLSTMVHDRLRADSLFEAEPVDAAWAQPLEPRLERHLRDAAAPLTSVKAECRSASCRVVLEHSGGWRVPEHKVIVDGVERAVESFMERNPGVFEPVFLIAAHAQEPSTPYVRVFLQRRGADLGS